MIRDQRDSLGGLLFVLLWSTGYISVTFALEGAAPLTVAVGRFVGTALLIGTWLLLRRAPRPPRAILWHAVVAGLLLQAGFFGFIYIGMRAGVEPAVAGLITGLMPLTTALGAALLLGEALRPKAALGLVLGVAGVVLVVGPELRADGRLIGYVCAGLALLSLSLGTIYQKRHGGGIEPRLGLLIHVSVSALVLLPIAWWAERLDIHPTPAALAGFAWLLVVNSCIGVLLYLWLLGRGGAARVSSVFFLVPPVTAVMAALVLDAHFSVVDAAGFGLAAMGVWLGQRA